MIVKELNVINRDIDSREQNRKIRKFLPFLVFVSFVWLCLFESYSQSVALVNSYAMEGYNELSSNGYLVLNLLLLVVSEWIWFEVIYYFYRTLVSFSLFAHTVPRKLFENKARIFIIYRNLVLGLFMNLLFFFPYLINFVLIMELLVDFGMFVLFFKSMSRETVSVMIMPNVLKSYFVPFALIELVHVLIAVVGVL